MLTITIEIGGNPDVLTALGQKLQNMNPFLTGFGEDMIERTKRRFATATDPNGQPWAANSQATVMNYLRRRGAFSAKTGKITAKGQTMAGSKKLLQGITRDLARQLFSNAADDSLTLGNSMVYAAMQQYGGKKAQFPNLWGDIPARRYLPISSSGQLDQVEVTQLINQLRDYLTS